MRQSSAQVESGVEVRRGFPYDETIDPFLELVHYKGLRRWDWQPRRGTAVITYVLDGEVAVEDTTGNQGVLRPGEVQVLVAGAGALHDVAASAEALEIHVNLPAAEKFCAPSSKNYFCPTFHGDGFRARVLAGAAFGLTGPISLPIHLIDVDAESGAQIQHDLPASFGLFVFIYHGTCLVGPEKVSVSSGDFLILDPDDDDDDVSASTRALITVPDDNTTACSDDGDSSGGSHCKFLLLAGTPLREPIARYGPFVMTSYADVAKAFADYNAGTFCPPPPESPGPSPAPSPHEGDG